MHEGGHQFETKDLQKNYCVESITVKEIQNLIKSLNDQIIPLVCVQGSCISK